MNKKLTIILCLGILAVMVGASNAAAQFAALADPVAPLGTAFTYQGYLTDGDSPADGVYDLHFILYDSASGGSQVSSTLDVADLAVSQGLFTAALDFGSGLFNGQALWLEVGVRPGGSSGEYTPLSPRQSLSAAPYALHALNADQLDGQQASAFAAAAHDHLGETWMGSDSSLVITGTYGAPYTSTLVLGNSSGDALSIPWAGGAGVVVHTAGAPAWVFPPPPLWGDIVRKNGFQVDGAEGFGLYVGHAHDGVYVGSAGDDGMEVGSVSGDGVLVGHAGDDGVEVGSVVGDGVYVDSAGRYGLSVFSAGGDGVYVESADVDGFRVESAGYRGVQVDSAGQDGFRVYSAGSAPDYSVSELNNGVEVNGAEGFGLFVGATGSNAIQVYSAGIDGVYVGSAGDDGVYIGSAGDYGVFVDEAVDDALWGDTLNAANEWGVYTPDKISAMNVTAQSFVLLARAAGPESLMPGDLVSAVGIGDPLPESSEPLALVRLADASAHPAVIGVVQARMVYAAQVGQDGDDLHPPELHSADGPALPGDYVAIVINGVVRVRVADPGGEIQPGARLAAAEMPGAARPLRSTTVDGISVSEGAPVLGVALSAPDAEGYAWVLVNPQ